jgi:lipid A ethanolaminephosphotransferase
MEGLEEKIDALEKGGVIVLHQKGSHGPAYFQRIPAEFRKFSPVCHTSQLQECSRSEIINAYDNSILYTDYVLSRLIDFLRQHEEDYDASLIYVSDHGESLGEKGIYLHGMPYMIAPDEQKHVPLLFWMSDGFASRFGVDRDCLLATAGDEFSHDNLFHSLLGLLDIHTGVYAPGQDMFRGCSRIPGHAGNHGA